MRPILVVLFALIALLAAAAGYFVLVPDATDFLDTTVIVADAKSVGKTVVAYAGQPYRDDYQAIHVNGHVDNLSDKEVRNVKLEIQLVTVEGAKKEKISYVVDKVEPKSRKTYDVNVGTIKGERTPKIKVLSIEVVQ